MAEFNVRYHYQSREGGSWSSTSDYVKTTDETPTASALIALLKEKRRSYYDIKIEEVERRGDKKVEYYVRYHYKSNPTSSSSSSTSDYVKWYDDDPSMSDIQVLIEGKRYNYCDISIDEVRKR